MSLAGDLFLLLIYLKQIFWSSDNSDDSDDSEDESNREPEELVPNLVDDEDFRDPEAEKQLLGPDAGNVSIHEHRF